MSGWVWGREDWTVGRVVALLGPLLRQELADRHDANVSPGNDSGVVPHLVSGDVMSIIASVPLPTEPAHGVVPEAIQHVEQDEALVMLTR